MAALTCGQADHSSADDLLAAVYCRRARGANGPLEAGVALATAARPEAETVFLCIGSCGVNVRICRRECVPLEVHVPGKDRRASVLATGRRSRRTADAH
jgi:hypothetical protein